MVSFITLLFRATILLKFVELVPNCVLVCALSALKSNVTLFAILANSSEGLFKSFVAAWRVN